MLFVVIVGSAIAVSVVVVMGAFFRQQLPQHEKWTHAATAQRDLCLQDAPAAHLQRDGRSRVWGHVERLPSEVRLFSWQPQFF